MEKIPQNKISNWSDNAVILFGQFSIFEKCSIMREGLCVCVRVFQMGKGAGCLLVQL